MLLIISVSMDLMLSVNFGFALESTVISHFEINVLPRRT